LIWTTIAGHRATTDAISAGNCLVGCGRECDASSKFILAAVVWEAVIGCLAAVAVLGAAAAELAAIAGRVRCSAASSVDADCEGGGVVSF